MWGKKAATVVIRPQRYTHEFMEASDLFTISFFGPQWQEAMAFCGTKSGRDVDKAKECGLTPVTLDGGVGFAQAKLVLVCKSSMSSGWRRAVLRIPRWPSAGILKRTTMTPISGKLLPLTKRNRGITP